MSKERLATIEDIQRVEDKLDSILDRLDRKFAAKWVEKFNVAFIGLVMVAVLNSVMHTVVKAINRGS